VSTRNFGIVGLLAFAVAASIACFDGQGDPETGGAAAVEEACPTRGTASLDTKQPTPSELLNLVGAALSCPDHVAHIEARVKQRAEAEPATVEYWLDLRDGVLRIRSDPGVRYDSEQIANDDGVFRRDSDDKPAEKTDYSPLCFEYGEPLLAYLVDEECFFLGLGPDLSVDTGEYADKNALVLRSRQLFPAGPDEDDGLIEYDSRAFVDPDTFVILGTSVQGSFEGQLIGAESIEAAYELEFVSRASLDAGFFEPSSIGYVEPNTEADALLGALYWLGETLAGSGGFSDLRLDDIWSPTRAVAAGEYIGIVYYESDVALHEYDVSKMDDASLRYWQNPSFGGCLAETVEVDLADGRGVIWGKGRESNGTCGPATHYEARVFFEETIVSIITSENTGAEFDSVAGMEHVMRALKRRI
jgi:hypothetical protein